MFLMELKVKNLFTSKIGQVCLYLLAIIILGVICFQYAGVAHFPTGDDPAVHIRYAKTLSIREIYSTLPYPIPLSIFKSIHELTSIEYPRLFTLTISTFLLFSSICIFILTRKISKSGFMAFIAAAIFATGGWVTDGLRMGLLAESFGWGMLALTLYFLASQNIVFTLVFSGLLALSHPFSFSVFIFVAILYVLTTIFSKDKKEHNFSITISLIYLLFAILIWLFDKELILKFVDFINPERAGWGERKLWEIVTTYDPKRIVIGFMALIGVMSNIKSWGKPAIKVIYILLFVGLFMSMNQIFGIRFLVFRFFPYLEMAIAVFAALGLVAFVERLQIVKYKNIAIILLAILALTPHYINNGKAVQNQVTDISLNDSMTAGDQIAIKWIDQNVSKDASIVATRKRLLWISALTGNKNTQEDITPFDLAATKKLYDSGNGFAYDYFYYSEVDTIPDEIKNNFDLIYNKMGVRLYKR